VVVEQDLQLVAVDIAKRVAVEMRVLRVAEISIEEKLLVLVAM